MFFRVLACEMAAFVQLAVYGVVLDFVVYRQASTVVDTESIAVGLKSQNCGRHGRQAPCHDWHLGSHLARSCHIL